MAHDVFISHSSKDKPAADAVCALLESDGLRCWIAPRDVQAGVSYAGAIIDAINECRAMVLIFSGAANGSPQIEREIERAANRRIPLLPFRIENVAPEHGLEYFLSTPHWLDAFTPPLEEHIRELSRQLHALLDAQPAPGAAAVATPAAAPPPPIPQRTRSRVATGTMVAIGAVLAGGALAAAGGAAVWLGRQHPAQPPPPAVASAASAPVASAASALPASAAAEAASSAAADTVAAVRPPVAGMGGSRIGLAGPRPGVGFPRPGVGGARPGPFARPRLAMQRPFPPLRRRPPPLRLRRRPFV